MHLAMFWGLLTPIQVFHLTRQQELHDPVNNFPKFRKDNGEYVNTYKHQNVTHQNYHASLNAFSNNYENFTSRIH